MSTFDSTKKLLGALLQSIVGGKVQLPDFQRGYGTTTISVRCW